MSGQRCSESSQILREQLELLKTDKDLTAMIKTIDDQLNQLLVEELQLRSMDINSSFNATTTGSSRIEMASHKINSDASNPLLLTQENVGQIIELDSTIKINKQSLDLIKTKDINGMEEDDDDDDVEEPEYII